MKACKVRGRKIYDENQFRDQAEKPLRRGEEQRRGKEVRAGTRLVTSNRGGIEMEFRDETRKLVRADTCEMRVMGMHEGITYFQRRER